MFIWHPYVSMYAFFIAMLLNARGRATRALIPGAEDLRIDRSSCPGEADGTPDRSSRSKRSDPGQLLIEREAATEFTHVLADTLQRVRIGCRADSAIDEAGDDPHFVRPESPRRQGRSAYA